MSATRAAVVVAFGSAATALGVWGAVALFGLRLHMAWLGNVLGAAWLIGLAALVAWAGRPAAGDVPTGSLRSVRVGLGLPLLAALALVAVFALAGFDGRVPATAFALLVPCLVAIQARDEEDGETVQAVCVCSWWGTVALIVFGAGAASTAGSTPPSPPGGSGSSPCSAS